VAVYVDDMRMEATVGTIHGRWSHLYADSDQELHDFAERIGLQRSWFQQHRSRIPDHPLNHYDVTESKRRQAINCGAIRHAFGDGGDYVMRRMESLKKT
jgi:Protein of unknown function (DUF4031)